MKHFKEIATSEKHASLVHKCTFQYSVLGLPQETSGSWGKSTMPWVTRTYDSFIQGFIASIPHFVNLHEITIHGFKKEIKNEVFTALAALRHLESASFKAVKFGIHTIESRLKIRNFYLDNQTEEEPPHRSSPALDIISGQYLQKLDLYSIPYSTRIFSALKGLGGCPELTHLSVVLHSTKDISALYSFLASCPKLISIRVECANISNEYAVPPLPTSTIPYLSSFCGPSTLAATFIPGRPVQKVAISLNFERSFASFRFDVLEEARRVKIEFLKDLFSSVAQSTEPITDLFMSYLPCRPEFLALISEYFPMLKRFTFDTGACNDFLFPRNNFESFSFLSQTSVSSFSSFLPIGDFAVDSTCSITSADRQKLDNKQLLPASMHSFYMPILHWITVNEVPFPESLETLSFRAQFPSTFSREEERKLAEKDQILGRPYTFDLANSILSKLGDRYSVLRKIEVVGKKEELCWTRNAGNPGWLYDGRRSYDSQGPNFDLVNRILQSRP
ncbi:hypothetical protein CPB84DRAFT_1767523 [Gymnopilus junonius]|uniref:Uncharacterized protein n=1 Tax=Gymnopilus junonius TaxID=109634 RepID=A0A9P5NVP1_GYMJU|nr:hypothetical protein CPB84DRAFT_1767523 [Gymnopilus junonius]